MSRSPSAGVICHTAPSVVSAVAGIGRDGGLGGWRGRIRGRICGVVGSPLLHGRGAVLSLTPVLACGLALAAFSAFAFALVAFLALAFGECVVAPMLVRCTSALAFALPVCRWSSLFSRLR